VWYGTIYAQNVVRELRHAKPLDMRRETLHFDILLFPEDSDEGGQPDVRTKRDNASNQDAVVTHQKPTAKDAKKQDTQSEVPSRRLVQYHGVAAAS
jgi:hypothetical protein